MNFLVDECCDALLVAGLRADGHDVLYIPEVAPGSDDNTVLQLAFSQQRVLLTEDKDFGELVVRLQLPALGIVLLRIEPAHSNIKLARLRDVILHDGSRIVGSFVVIDETKARFRSLKA